MRHTLRVLYFPYYGAPSPFQKRLYDGLTSEQCRPGTVDECLTLQEAAEEGGMLPALHLHWVASLLTPARTADEAEALREAFVEKLSRFVHQGGQVVWIVHAAELSWPGRFANVALRLFEDVAQWAFHIHAPDYGKWPSGGLKSYIDSDKLRALAADPSEAWSDTWEARFSSQQLDIDGGLHSCLLTGRSFPPSRTARTAIIVLNYRMQQQVQQLIRALNGMSDQDFDLYVVDNASPGLSRYDLAVLFPRAHVIGLPENFGYAGGNNAALRLVVPLGYDFVWILNPDIGVGAEALAQHVAAADAYPDHSIFGAAILRGAVRDRLASAGGFVTLDEGMVTGNLYGGKHVNALPEEPFEADCITGASIFLRTAVLEEIGYLPEQYFLYFEETDWLLRATGRGYPSLVLPHVHLLHHQASHAGGVPRIYYFYYYLRNAVLFSREMVGEDGTDATISTLRCTFLEGWFKRISENAPNQVAFYEALAERAFEDGRVGRTGRIDLEALSDELQGLTEAS